MSGFPLGGRRLRLAVVLSVLLALLGCSGPTRPRRDAAPGEGTPTFRLRLRIEPPPGSEPPQLRASFVQAGKVDARLSDPIPVPRGTWSSWMVFGPDQARGTRNGYPNTGLPENQTVAYVAVTGITRPSRLQGEIQLDEGGDVIPVTAEIFGPRLGIMLWRQDGVAHAGTEADYNRRYWRVIDEARLPARSRPGHFTIVDGFVTASDDLRTWREGIEEVQRLGANTVSVPNSPELRGALGDELGPTASGVYCPPGYAFDYMPQPACADNRVPNQAGLDAWAGQLSTELKAGEGSAEPALIALSDEPGWDYPEALRQLETSAEGMSRFHAYLRGQGLTPEELGRPDWAQVLPLDRSQASDPPSRRLFYWTMRFFPWDSARHFAAATAALERNLHPGVPISVNWNNFGGPSYSPDPSEQNPGGATGHHDWLEFGRMRGATALWSEDWFADPDAYLWSSYASRLRSAAAKGGVGFGGHVVGRLGGDRPDGVAQKALSLVGQGAKTLSYYTFGPEYNTPGNAYSETMLAKPRLAKDIAGANRLIGESEDLLWPGKPVPNRVALVYPRSAEMWDPQDPVVSRADVLTAYSMDYRTEVHQIYLALQHANIPVDWIEEEDLTADQLTPYRVVYLTAPNVPREGAEALVDWVRAGGSLVTVSGAGQRDRYDDPLTALADASGIREGDRRPLVVPDASALPEVAMVAGGGSAGVPAFGVRGELRDHGGAVEAMFADGTPAIVAAPVGAGRFVHLAFLPGISYFRSAAHPEGHLPSGHSEPLRRWITAPVVAAGVRPPVDVSLPMVETPALSSPQGSAITVLNWSDTPGGVAEFRYRAPFPVDRVTSVIEGDLPFKTTDDGVSFSMPVAAADVVRVYPRAASGTRQP